MRSSTTTLSEVTACCTEDHKFSDHMDHTVEQLGDLKLRTAEFDPLVQQRIWTTASRLDRQLPAERQQHGRWIGERRMQDGSLDSLTQTEVALEKSVHSRLTAQLNAQEFQLWNGAVRVPHWSTTSIEQIQDLVSKQPATATATSNAVSPVAIYLHPDLTDTKLVGRPERLHGCDATWATWSFVQQSDCGPFP